MSSLRCVFKSLNKIAHIHSQASRTCMKFMVWGVGYPHWHLTPSPPQKKHSFPVDTYVFGLYNDSVSSAHRFASARDGCVAQEDLKLIMSSQRLPKVGGLAAHKEIILVQYFLPAQLSILEKTKQKKNKSSKTNPLHG